MKVGLWLTASLVLASSSTDVAAEQSQRRGLSFFPKSLSKHTVPLDVRRGGSISVSSLLSAVAAQKLSVTEDATDTLDVSIPLSQAATLQQGRDGPLMRDINMLTDILGDIVKRENPKVHALFEEFRQYGRERWVEVLFIASMPPKVAL